jgi:hypothetical protein
VRIPVSEGRSGYSPELPFIREFAASRPNIRLDGLLKYALKLPRALLSSVAIVTQQRLRIFHMVSSRLMFHQI